MAQNLISVDVVSLIWIVIRFSFVFADSVAGIVRNPKYWLFRIPADDLWGTIPIWMFFLFQMMFAVITPALITGAFVDRFRFSSYLLFIAVWSVLVYSVLSYWVWGGGLLAELGAIDFAGSTVVHLLAGMAVLAIISVFGNRERRTPSHDVRFVALGADGTAVCWGQKAATSLWRPRPEADQLSPPADERFVAISSGTWHICGLRADATAVCWGYYYYGQASPPAGERFWVD